MPGLVDIAKLRKTVTIGEGDTSFEVQVKGISAKKIAAIIYRFPAVGNMLFPTQAGQASADDPGRMIAEAPEAVTAIIHAGSVEDIKEEDIEDMPVGYQIDVLLAILDITLPGGLVPFINKLTRLFGDAASQVPLNVAASPNVTSMPNGKAPDSSSPSQ